MIVIPTVTSTVCIQLIDVRPRGEERHKVGGGKMLIGGIQLLKHGSHEFEVFRIVERPAITTMPVVVLKGHVANAVLLRLIPNEGRDMFPLERLDRVTPSFSECDRS